MDQRSHQVVVFDFDGVLSRVDSMTVLVTRRLRERPQRLLMALPIVAAHLCTGPLPPVQAALSRLLVSYTLAGSTADAIRAECRALGEEMAQRREWRNDEVLARLRAHVDAGHYVVICTATATDLAQAYVDALNLPTAHVLGSRLEETVKGVCLGNHNHGKTKPRSLLRSGVTGPISVAYTDSPSDIPLVKLAEAVVLVGASRRTFDRVRRATAVPIELM